MRTAIRLGLVAASLAGSAVLSTPASANHHCPVWLGSDTGSAVAVCPVAGSVQVFPYGAAYVVCYMGNEPVQVWVASNTAGIPPFDVVQALLNRVNANPGMICTPPVV